MVTRQIAFMMPAATNHQMFCEKAQIIAGTLHARMIEDQRRQPAAQLVGDGAAHQRPEDLKPQLTLSTSPMLRSVRPSASM
jgi:hypothetical protein